MNIEVRNPKKPKRLERKFRINKREWKILTHREIERFKKLSRTEQLKINNIYAKSIMNSKPLYMVECTHRDTINLKLKLNNGFVYKWLQCSNCKKVLETTIYWDRGFGCPFPNPKNV